MSVRARLLGNKCSEIHVRFHRLRVPLMMVSRVETKTVFFFFGLLSFYRDVDGPERAAGGARASFRRNEKKIT